MAISDAQKKAVRKYKEAHYDRQEVSMPKGKKEKVKAHAERQGESVNSFINRAIDETMARDTGKVYVRDDGWSDTIKQALQKVDDPPSDRAGNETLQVAQTTMTE